METQRLHPPEEVARDVYCWYTAVEQRIRETRGEVTRAIWMQLIDEVCTRLFQRPPEAAVVSTEPDVPHFDAKERILFAVQSFTNLMQILQASVTQADPSRSLIPLADQLIETRMLGLGNSLPGDALCELVSRSKIVMMAIDDVVMGQEVQNN